jgi:hypothetical protein
VHVLVAAAWGAVLVALLPLLRATYHQGFFARQGLKVDLVN